jgi:hypothetical protein
MNAITAFALLSLVLTVTPGPDSLLVLRSSLQAGRRAGIRVAAGATSGSLFWGICSAAGLTAVMAASVQAFRAVQLAGAAYLAFQGIRGWRAAKSPSDGSPSDGSSGIHLGLGRRRSRPARPARAARRGRAGPRPGQHPRRGHAPRRRRRHPAHAAPPRTRHQRPRPGPPGCLGNLSRPAPHPRRRRRSRPRPAPLTRSGPCRQDGGSQRNPADRERGRTPGSWIV